MYKIYHITKIIGVKLCKMDEAIENQVRINYQIVPDIY